VRFFDGEEAMLLSFLHDNYRDGTYIEKTGSYRQLNDYVITPLGFTEAGGKKFSFDWKVELKDITDGKYMIVPKMNGQMNHFYFELLADIKDNFVQELGGIGRNAFSCLSCLHGTTKAIFSITHPTIIHIFKTLGYIDAQIKLCYSKNIKLP
jgi:hypothetical protein